MKRWIYFLTGAAAVIALMLIVGVNQGWFDRDQNTNSTNAGGVTKQEALIEDTNTQAIEGTETSSDGVDAVLEPVVDPSKSTKEPTAETKTRESSKKETPSQIAPSKEKTEVIKEVDKEAAAPAKAVQPKEVAKPAAANEPEKMNTSTSPAKKPGAVKPEENQEAEKPKAPVKEAAKNQEDWAVPARYRDMKNPAEADKESLSIGKSLYSKHCRSCHGKEGLGDGPKAAQLDTPSGDFTARKFQQQTDGTLFYKTKEGRDDMPSFERKIPDEEDIWHIVNYLRALGNP